MIGAEEGESGGEECVENVIGEGMFRWRDW